MIWYRVQIGAYRFKRNAEKVCVDLIEKGFKTTMPKENGKYVVRIGSFNDHEKAVNLLFRVKKHKKYEKAKIFTWDDGKKVDVSSVSTTYYEDPPVIKFVGIWHSESNESLYGDAELFVEYDNDENIKHAILVDTGMAAGDTIKKLKKWGIKTLDAVVISHAHGDHYGALSNVLNEFVVKHLYLPGVDGLKKYQPAYAKAIQNQEKKAKKLGIPVTYVTTGTQFQFGHIHCKCVYQVPASDMKKHDNHYFVNNQSVVLIFTLDGHGKVFLSGDLQNEGNALLIKYFAKEIVADVGKCAWHGDGNAMTEALAKAVGALSWFWNFHHAERKGGRQNTRKKLEKAGVKHILRNYEDGDIFYTYCNREWSASSSKKTIKNVMFRSRF